MKLLENDDSVRETSKEANTGTSINEPLDLKSGRKRKFEGSGTCIPEYRKPIENYESTPAKQAKLSDFVLNSMKEVNMINEIRGRMYLHALSRQLFVEKHGTSISQKLPSFKGTLMWQSAEDEEKSSIVYLHVILAFTDKDVILLALNKLESLFIKTKQLTPIVVSGDFKVYKLLCEIKMDYGKEMDWLLPYSGGCISL